MIRDPLIGSGVGSFSLPVDQDKMQILLLLFGALYMYLTTTLMVKSCPSHKSTTKCVTSIIFWDWCSGSGRLLKDE